MKNKNTVCLYCKSLFKKKSNNQKFCSIICSKKYYKEKNTQNHCIDCGILILNCSKRCYSCNALYKFSNAKNATRYIDGRTLKKNYCVDCGVEISYNAKRCKKCNSKEHGRKLKNGHLKEETKQKMSLAHKGKMPKNLRENINLKDSPPQREMFYKIKKYFSNVEYNKYVKTPKTWRFLDVGIIDLKIDFEYDGKIHLSKKIKKADYKRDLELISLGWKIYRFNKDNFYLLDDLLINLVKKYNKKRKQNEKRK